MDVQAIIGEVARRHGILITSNEPGFAFLTMQEMVLEEHLAKVDRRLDAFERDRVAKWSEQDERARWVSQELISLAGKRAADMLGMTVQALSLELRRLANEAASARLEALDAKTSARRWALISGGSALVAAGIALGRLL